MIILSLDVRESLVAILGDATSQIIFLFVKNESAFKRVFKLVKIILLFLINPHLILKIFLRMGFVEVLSHLPFPGIDPLTS